MLLQENWNKHEIVSVAQLKALWEAGTPALFAIDTETNGIFQVTAKPFLIVFGWSDKDPLKKSTVVVFEPTSELLVFMYKLCGTVNTGFMHNAKFDLHMLKNFDNRGYPHKNIIDTITVARLVLESRTAAQGGPSLALKALADKYLEKGSKEEQKQVKKFKATIQKEIARELNEALQEAGFDKKEYNKVILERIESDPVKDVATEDIPQKVKEIWKTWTEKYPRTKGMKRTDRVTFEMIYNYSRESKQKLKDYAHSDVIYTLEIAKKFMPYIIKLEQTEILLKESAAMYAFWDSERVGLKLDLPYIRASKEKMKGYIQSKREELQSLLNDDLDASTFAASPKQIKDWLKEQGEPSESTAQDVLIELAENSSNDKVKKVLSAVLRIRKLIKKYSTDLLGYELMEHNGRRYTSFNQNGAVTGRVTNDMQQMPNEGILDDDGNELFHPRKAVVPSTDEGFKWIAYIDYSQIEVRIQAHYTYVAMNGKGDKNMLRMFVPFDCTVEGTKVEWDPKLGHNDQALIDSNTWIQKDDGKVWEPVDFHMITALEAFPHIRNLPKTDPEVIKYRKKAKPINFAIQYGAGINKVKTMADTPEEGEKIFKANKAAFVGLDAFDKMLRKQFYGDGYIMNIFGRKYKTKYYSHKLGNMVIQGSGAQLLKEKIVETNEYLKNYKSRIIHNIHDEIQFEIHKSELFVVKRLKKIMETTGDMFVVPVVADMELTTTNWEGKYDYEGDSIAIEDLIE